MSEDWERARTAGPRGARGLAVAALALAVVAGLVLTTGDGGSEEEPDAPPELVIEPDGDPTPAPPPTADPEQPQARTVAVRPAGSWSEPVTLDDLAARDAPRVARLDDRLLVWGGRDDEGWRDDGALLDAEDPGAGAEALPAAPVSDDAAAALHARDGEVLVLGGLDGDGGTAHARYDGQAWQRLPAPPSGRWRWQASAATSEGVAVAGDVDGAAAVAAHDLAAGSWTRLAGVPLVDVRTLAALDDDLVAIGATSEDGRELAATRYAGGSWSEPDPLPGRGNWTPRAATDPASGRVVAVGATHDRGRSHLAAAWSPRRGWERLTSAPAALARAEPRLEPTPAGLVAWASGAPDAAALLPADDDPWRPLAAAPDLGGDAGAVWTGQALAVVGDAGGEALSLATWSPQGHGGVALPPAGAPQADGRWERLEVGETRLAPALAAAGERVVAWGGRVGAQQRDDGLVIDLGEGTVAPLPTAPVPAGPSPAATTAGDGVLVLGERGATARYDLDTGAWETVEPPPGADAGEVVLGRGAGADAVAASPQAVARLDTATGRWQALPDPPEGLLPDGLATGPDGALVLLGAGGEVARLDGEAWTVLADPGLAPPLSAAVLPGSVVVWDGEAAVVLDERDRWRPTRPGWSTVAGGAITPMGESGQVLVWGGAQVGDALGGRTGAAVLDTGESVWRTTPDPPGWLAPQRWLVAGDAAVGWSDDGAVVRFVPRAALGAESGTGG